jgi:DNA-directed RNA polymerase subunit RPC12/RpoP
MSARSAGNDEDEDRRLYCPECNTTLGYYYVAIVLSSGNCPHCGERLLDD